MATLSEYKGHTLLVLNPDDKFPMQFGLSKARLVMDNIEAIRAFVDSEGKSCGSTTAGKPSGDPFAEGGK